MSNIKVTLIEDNPLINEYGSNNGILRFYSLSNVFELNGEGIYIGNDLLINDNDYRSIATIVNNDIYVSGQGITNKYRKYNKDTKEYIDCILNDNLKSGFESSFNYYNGLFFFGNIPGVIGNTVSGFVDETKDIINFSNLELGSSIYLKLLLFTNNEHFLYIKITTDSSYNFSGISLMDSFEGNENKIESNILELLLNYVPQIDRQEYSLKSYILYDSKSTKYVLLIVFRLSYKLKICLSTVLNVEDYLAGNITRLNFILEDINIKPSSDLATETDNSGNTRLTFVNLEGGSVSGAYYITANIESTSFTLTLDFGDEGTKDIVCEKDVKKIDIDLNYSNNITLKLTYSDNSISTQQVLDKPNTWKYLESVSINGSSYLVVNGKISIDLVLNSNTTLTFQNGAIHYFAIVFYNDNFLLQSERLAEGTLPTYKGATPVKAGYVFTGRSPEPYLVDKYQDYQATFEEIIKTYKIDIVDSNNLPINLLWSNTGQDNTFDKKIIAISIKNIDFGHYLLYSVNVKYENENEFTLICQVGYNNVKATPNNYTINNVNYEFENEYELEINSDTTITINSVEETPTLQGNFISKAGTTTPFTKIKFINKYGNETEITDFNFATK